MNKPDYLTKNDWSLLEKKYKNLDKVIKKLNKNYPVQYLIGNVDFYGYEIDVNKNVLIPRFETETLLEKTMDYLKKYDLDNANVLEIGTGSGCIPVVLKSKMPSLSITSIDKSIRALHVAKHNIRKHKLDVTLIHKSLFRFRPINKYNLIISNPPYISEDEVIDPKCKYEPNMALYAKNDGLAFYDYILTNASSFVTDKFIMAFEIGEKQGKYLKKLAKDKFPKAKITIEKDLADKDRYLFIINE